MQLPKLYFVGAGLGIGGRDHGSADAPIAFQQSPHLANLPHVWHKTIMEHAKDKQQQLDIIRQYSIEAAQTIAELLQKQRRFCVIGGDHSCAIGTWSGASHALSEDMGLIWVDAHMDAHTPETTQTNNIHGMPVATLLGRGYKELTGILSTRPKLKPQHLCLIGIRSYEADEKALLNTLGVKIFYIEDVHRLGITEVIKLAHAHVTQDCPHFGISIDLDGLDPEHAPGTGTPVEDGINADEFCETLKSIGKDPRLIGYEITEFHPHLDNHEKITEQTIFNIIKALEHEYNH
jgi:arginase